MRLHFLKLDLEFFCLQPSLARLYSAAASPSERLRSDGSLAINRGRLSPTPKIINVIDIIEHLNFGIFFFNYLLNNSLAVLHEKRLIRQIKGLFKGLFGRHE